MTIHTFYRLSIWTPLVVPAVIAALVHGPGLTIDLGPLGKLVQILLSSLLYGGVPYSILAIWATWWVGGRTESEIKRMMFRSPLLMVATFVPISVVTGLAVGQPVPFLAVAVLGAMVCIPLGYVYVCIVLLLREEVGATDVKRSEDGGDAV